MAARTLEGLYMARERTGGLVWGPAPRAPRCLGLVIYLEMQPAG
jgi:hypothetical protein